MRSLPFAVCIGMAVLVFCTCLSYGCLRYVVSAFIRLRAFSCLVDAAPLPPLSSFLCRSLGLFPQRQETLLSGTCLSCLARAGICCCCISCCFHRGRVNRISSDAKSLEPPLFVRFHLRCCWCKCCCCPAAALLLSVLLIWLLLFLLAAAAACTWRSWHLAFLLPDQVSKPQQQHKCRCMAVLYTQQCIDPCMAVHPCLRGQGRCGSAFEYHVSPVLCYA